MTDTTKRAVVTMGLVVAGLSPAFAQYAGAPDQALRSSRADRSFHGGNQKREPPEVVASPKGVPLPWPLRFLRSEGVAWWYFLGPVGPLIALLLCRTNGHPIDIPFVISYAENLSKDFSELRRRCLRRADSRVTTTS